MQKFFEQGTVVLVLNASCSECQQKGTCCPLSAQDPNACVLYNQGQALYSMHGPGTI